MFKCIQLLNCMYNLKQKGYSWFCFSRKNLLGFWRLGCTNLCCLWKYFSRRFRFWLHLVLQLGFGSVNPQTMFWIIQKPLGLPTAEAPDHCESSVSILPSLPWCSGHTRDKQRTALLTQRPLHWRVLSQNETFRDGLLGKAVEASQLHVAGVLSQDTVRCLV